MTRALELTWVETLRQWRKRRNVSGKRKDFYLGTGKGRDDWASYQRALANWRVKTSDEIYRQGGAVLTCARSSEA